MEWAETWSGREPDALVAGAEAAVLLVKKTKKTLLWASAGVGFMQDGDSRSEPYGRV